MADSSDVTIEAMVARENEKRTIREEIIASGFFWRQELEAEVIRELVLERENAMRRTAGFSFNNFPLSSLQSGQRGLFSTRRDGFGFNDRPYMLNGKHGDISGRLSLTNYLEGGTDANPSFANCPEVGICGGLPLENRLDHGTDGRPSLINLPGSRVSSGLPFQHQLGITSEIPSNPMIDLRQMLTVKKCHTLEGGTDANLSFANRPEVGISGRLPLENLFDDGTDGRLSLINLPGSRVSSGLSFQHQPGVMSEILSKPMIDLRQTLNLVKPETAFAAGTKRKSETPIILDDEVTLSGKGKKSQKGLTCEICQVSVTNERGLEDHLKGKKHKKKEKAMQTTPTKPSEECDLLPQESGNSVKLPTATTDTSQSMIVDENQDLKSLKDLKDINRELKNENNDVKYWCKACNVGTDSEALMTAHRKGNEHMTLVQEKGGGVIAIRNDNIIAATEGKDESKLATASSM